MKKLTLIISALLLITNTILPKTALAEDVYARGVDCPANPNSQLEIIGIHWDEGKQQCVNLFGNPAIPPIEPFCSDNRYTIGVDPQGNKHCYLTQGATVAGAQFACQGGAGVDTAIGCIPVVEMTDFLGFLLKWAIGLSGGVIMIMLILTGYGLLTSSGDPQKLQGAKENIVAIFSGLILIGFSLVLLQTIGADILLLPTFTK